VSVVWEPILPTDWWAPSTIVLRRLADTRARQYWDMDHVLARRMAQDARPPQPTQGCCVRSKTLWDLAAVYPQGVRWTGQMPIATLFDGPVVDVIDGIEAALSGLK
jgi:hypothetical protein